MPGECPICIHPERLLIEQSIASGTLPDGNRASTRGIAAHWGLSSHMRVQAHKPHILGQPTPVVVKVPETAPKTVAKTHVAALAEVTTVPSRPGADADPLDQCRWLITVTQGILERLDKEGNEALALKAIKELRGQFTLVASLLGKLRDRVEISGPGGGPVPIAALVQHLPPVVQQLYQEEAAGDLIAQRALERYAATGRTDPQEQIAELRRMLREAESEITLIAPQ